MSLSNLTMTEYTDMTQQERDNYRDGWMYIHSRKKG